MYLNVNTKFVERYSCVKIRHKKTPKQGALLIKESFLD
ncbi:hypothetical protein PPIS_a3244 [Pseudoalteromonas piscicida]|uniref:Uncharacterized protein n=1 Tax=Pseudoalteromonas piscicida TaxID=43662 RepID=A0ABM6NGD4_PSEO7|nr:hypothetical protein PPIS_a3244 [Pseudoalteromonas piscicida]